MRRCAPSLLCTMQCLPTGSCDGGITGDELRCGPQVGGFMRVRRALLSVLSDAAYDTVQSFHSDSAVAFSIFLHHLPDLTQQHPPHVLLRAMEVTSWLELRA